MGFFDYVSDLYASLSVQTAEAEEPVNAGPKDNSGEQTSGKDHRSGGIGTAQHDRGAQVKGGASAKWSPAAGTDESPEEAEVNKKDAEGAKARATSTGGADKSDSDTDNAGAADGDDAGESDEGGDEEGGDEEEEDEEEEEEEEPEDIKPKLEEECLKTPQCAPLKHHYDECAERVQQQIDDNGKADEDCVEEFFHMMHCATQCAAPKLFRQLR